MYKEEKKKSNLHLKKMNMILPEKGKKFARGANLEESNHHCVFVIIKKNRNMKEGRTKFLWRDGKKGRETRSMNATVGNYFFTFCCCQ